MDILYYGITGSAPSEFTGWILIALGALITMMAVCIAVEYKNAKILFALVATLLFLVTGIFSLVDTRAPIVKATIDKDISWHTIQENYELYKQEGRLYTLKVKNVDLDEWLSTMDQKNAEE